MKNDILDKYILAGRIASEVREASRPLIRIGMPLIEIAEKVEAMIRERSGQPAFPVNLSLNEIAAHYTPAKNDEMKIKDGDVIKVDIGVHVDGFVGDTAYTVSFNEKYEPLVKASETALDEAIKLCRPGTLLSDVSSKIEETIKSFGFNPVSNLTGHGLEQYNLHADPQVPNVKFHSNHKLSENQVIAIEPFATNGVGMIKDSEPTLIFMLLNPKPVRNMDARLIMKFAGQFGHEVEGSMHALPFAERWIDLSLFKTRIALRELREKGVLYEYPVLKEVSKGIVTQFEHTVIVKDEPIVTTK